MLYSPWGSFLLNHFENEEQQIQYIMYYHLNKAVSWGFACLLHRELVLKADFQNKLRCAKSKCLFIECTGFSYKGKMAPKKRPIFLVNKD